MRAIDECDEGQIKLIERFKHTVGGDYYNNAITH